MWKFDLWLWIFCIEVNFASCFILYLSNLYLSNASEIDFFFWTFCSLLNQPRLRVEDTVIFLLQRAHSHLATQWESPSVISSSAVNTIQPLLLREELQTKTSQCLVSYWLPDRQTTVCPSWHCFVWCGAEWHGSTAGDRAVSIPVYPVHLRLSVRLLQKFSEDSAVVDGRKWTERWWLTFWSGLGGTICFWMCPRPERRWVTSGRRESDVTDVMEDLDMNPARPPTRL